MTPSTSGYVDIVTLANCSAWLPSGEELKIGQLWQKQTVILIFLRHFACIACRAHASQVWNEREKYEKSGAKLIFIGNGSPDFIEKFKEDMNMGGAMILTDPTLESFRAAGLKRGILALVQPKSMTNAVKLAMQGHRQTAYTADAGHLVQLGGVVAINTHSKILYHFRSESFGDLPLEPHLEIIKADEEKAAG
jgi:peroxiredoxin